MRLSWSHWRSRWAAFIYDLACIPIAWLGAFWLRFNLDQIPSDILGHAFSMLPMVIFCQVFTFWGFGLYRGVWRFASMPDLSRIIKSIMLGGLLTLLTFFLVTRLAHLPRSVIPLYSLLLLFMLGGARFAFRWFKDKKTSLSSGSQKVLIVGAGQAGESLVRDLKRHSGEFQPIVFVDDRAHKIGREIHGLRVQGSSEDIPALVKQYGIDIVMIAIPSATAQDMRRIVGVCESIAIPVRTLPSINDLLSGKVSLNEMRKISLEDLLGRDPVKIDWQAITQSLANQCVWVTGGGGSIGSELCRQILRHLPDKLVVVDHCEYHIFQLEQELNQLPPQIAERVTYRLLDVCDIPGVWKAMGEDNPDVIFHAAAYKHVPILEPQIRVAVKNNILGTACVAQAAVALGAKKFLLVSTDKAVNPSCVMGATKRIAEMICQSLHQQHATEFTTVRFGNVLGSKGSVVEIFQKQLAQGGPLTVTHPEVMRYFMTIQEACQLILQGLTMSTGGELFVLDMGEPVKIRYMAEQMIRLAGKKLDDIQIQYIGLKPGEKLFEELFHSKEQLLPTPHAKIMKAQTRMIDHRELDRHLKIFEERVFACQEDILMNLMQHLVPEFKGTQHSMPGSESEPVVVKSQRELEYH
ncbi:MAG: nucleoside-diphosphate sugar epimerase/dehydratase [Gammaproteobacteria bacterium]